MSNPYKFMDLPPINDCVYCFGTNCELNNNDYETLFWVTCIDCEASGPTRITSTIAIEGWNTPTYDIDRLRAECTRLRRELDDCNGVIR